MTMQPIFGVLLGPWELVILLAVVGMMALVAVACVVVIALTRQKGKPADGRKPAGSQPPPLCP